jgi:D-3-phosphoglycerate dehydrogenase
MKQKTEKTVQKKPRVLISDKIDERGIDELRETCEVVVKTGLGESELVKIISGFDAQIVRAATRVTAKVIKAGKNLKIVGRAGVGVDNIDVAAATQAGILVVNSPEGNILSAAEHTIAMMMSLARCVPQANRSMHDGKWEKSKFMGCQVGEKTLGVVGYGKIGKLVAERAVGLGMKVLVADPYTNEQAVTRIGGRLVDKKELFKDSDFITFHVPKSAETFHMIGKDEFKKMKDGVRLVNCSRGGVIQEDALIEAVKSGKVAGAALDVFEKEPLEESELRDLPNVILTPHLGASTIEAQVNVAVDVARQISDFLQGKPVTGAVNLPPLKPEILKLHQPYFEMAEKLGRLHESLRDSSVSSIELTFEGDPAEMQTKLITNYFLLGMMKPRFSDAVNIVNVELMFSHRNVDVSVNKKNYGAPSGNIITAVVKTQKGSHTASAALIGGGEMRIVSIDGLKMNLVPEGRMLMISHLDKPGMIGKVGTVLGMNNINIAGMVVGREKVRGKAIMALGIDDEASAEVLKQIRAIHGMKSVRMVSF